MAGQLESVESHLDMMLVPAGLFLLLAYHLHLLYRTVRHPKTTVIGMNAINRRMWVHNIMKGGMKNGMLAVQTIRNSIMASTLLASTSITLCSVFGLLLGRADQTGGMNTAGKMGSVKVVFVLVCFLVAFVCHAQCVRYYSHVSFLITTPPLEPEEKSIHVEYVSRVFNRGGYFWSMGLRAFYFSLPLFLWNFGAIPMFVSSCGLLSVLHFLDRSTEIAPTRDPHTLHRRLEDDSATVEIQLAGAR